MFCVQCEHTIRTPQGDSGCSFARGMCGKTSEVSDLQDMLVHLLQAVSTYAVAARKVGIVDAEIDAYVPQAFFSTLTNVNFDAERVIDFSRRAETCRKDLRARYEAACAVQGVTPEALPAAAHYRLPDAKTVMLSDALQFALNRQKNEVGEDVIGLRLLCLYGLKGAAAYMEHARVLGPDRCRSRRQNSTSSWPSSARSRPTPACCSSARWTSARSTTRHHGNARHGRDRDLRPPRAYAGQHATGQGQGHRRLRP